MTPKLTPKLARLSAVGCSRGGSNRIQNRADEAVGRGFNSRRLHHLSYSDRVVLSPKPPPNSLGRLTIPGKPEAVASPASGAECR